MSILVQRIRVHYEQLKGALSSHIELGITVRGVIGGAVPGEEGLWAGVVVQGRDLLGKRRKSTSQIDDNKMEERGRTFYRLLGEQGFGYYSSHPIPGELTSLVHMLESSNVLSASHTLVFVYDN
jgi:hypothetical protein